MRSLILCLAIGILFAGYSVATKASNLVQGIKVQQAQQIALLNK